MSERQAKLSRKNEQKAHSSEKKSSPKKVLFDIAVVVIVLAVAGAGGYAAWNKIQEGRAQTAATEQQQQPQTQTVADIAKEKGMTGDELLAKLGFEGELSETSDISELYSKFTIESYAKFEDKTAEELKKEYKIEALSNDTLWQEAQMKVPMSVFAEQSGTSFDEFAKNNGLPEGITENTTYEEAMSIMQSQQAQQSEETEENNPAEQADGE